MKKTAIGIAVVLTGFTTVAYTLPPKDHSWYNGAKIGWSQYHDTGYYGNGYLNTDGPTRAIQLGAGAFLGYQSTPYLGFELGYDWLGRMAYKGTVINGALKAQGVQLAAKLNFPLNNHWDLYTRVGGMVWRVDTTQNNLIDDLNITHISHHDTGFSPLASVGVEYAINKNWATRLDYQWTNNIGNSSTVGTRPDNGTISIGISYRFGQDQNEETVHTIIPATVKTPVVKPKHFTLKSDVLFNFNKSTLKPQGQKTLDKLYDQLQSIDSKDGTIVVIGFADRIGSNHYNQKLSEKRSQSVVEYLVSKGIPYNKISASGMGEANPVTGNVCNNIKNRNILIKCLAPDRRVEINVQGTENMVT